MIREDLHLHKDQPNYKNLFSRIILLFLNDELTLSAMELQSELLTCPCLLRQPLLQLLLLLQELVYLLVVAEGLAHQLRLGHLGMFKLRGEGRENERTRSCQAGTGAEAVQGVC